MDVSRSEKSTHEHLHPEGSTIIIRLPLFIGCSQLQLTDDAQTSFLLFSNTLSLS